MTGRPRADCPAMALRRFPSICPTAERTDRAKAQRQNHGTGPFARPGYGGKGPSETGRLGAHAGPRGFESQRTSRADSAQKPQAQRAIPASGPECQPPCALRRQRQGRPASPDQRASDGDRDRRGAGKADARGKEHRETGSLRGPLQCACKGPEGEDEGGQHARRWRPRPAGQGRGRRPPEWAGGPMITGASSDR